MRAAATVLLLLLLVSCASISPQQEWAAAATLYTHTLDGLSVLKEQGILSDADKEAIEPFRAVAREAIDALEEVAATGETSRLATALEVFNAAIDEMLKWLAKGQMERDS